ncbi:MAG: hypothetical protein HGA45_39055 [Chloroflexales bacterium]|nr:hypothetical protein [Chloroflexales bacterium]
MASNLRVRLFVLICALCLIVAVGYVWYRARQVAGTATGPGSAAGALPTSEGGASTAAEVAGALPDKPFVVFRNSVLGSSYGLLATVPLDNPSGPRTPTNLSCERLYFAAGSGICLTANRDVITTYQAFLFDSSLQLRYSLPLKGIPSRTRVSPDGRYASVTVFVSGHSYAPGTFATRTEIYRTADGSLDSELEQFTVERDGKIFRDVDFNFWGVTFANDSNRFYSTLATGGKNYLIEGDLSAHHARVIHANVECPSLSPDGKRIAFKRMTESGWRIYVVDLETGAEHPTSETHSIDDQVEWLDDSHLLYGFDEDILVVPADGSGAPAVFIADASSPAVVR